VEKIDAFKGGHEKKCKNERRPWIRSSEGLREGLMVQKNLLCKKIEDFERALECLQLYLIHEDGDCVIGNFDCADERLVFRAWDKVSMSMSTNKVSVSMSMNIGIGAWYCVLCVSCFQYAAREAQIVA
jgi:hypothetical protein